MISTVLPESGFVHCGGYVHAVDHQTGTSKKELLALLAYFNSFTCDWWARRIVDRHVTSPAINNLPIPEWDDEQINRAANLAAELTRRGGIETLPGGRTLPDETGYDTTEREEIRAQIESVVAKGFELNRDELVTVLRDFSKKACSGDLRERILSLAEGNTSDTPTAEQNND